LLVRRSLIIGELAFYRCAAPTSTSLAALARVAGCRWRVEESFQAPPRACAGWMSIRCAAGAPGTGG
jgi:hypothetical protein